MDKQTEHVEKLSAQILEWDVQIEMLKEKAESATGVPEIGGAFWLNILQTLLGYIVAVAVLVIALGLCIWAIGKLWGSADHERVDFFARGPASGKSVDES